MLSYFSAECILQKVPVGKEMIISAYNSASSTVRGVSFSTYSGSLLTSDVGFCLLLISNSTVLFEQIGSFSLVFATSVELAFTGVAHEGVQGASGVSIWVCPKDVDEGEVAVDTPECDESNSFFLDLLGFSAEPANLF